MIIKSFKVFESRNDIEAICHVHKIKDYIINEDESVDVNGNVRLLGIRNGKIPLKFRNVSGDFNCSNNNLTSLEGSPQSVGEDFDCSQNILLSLKGGPESVKGDYLCGVNSLSSLEGSPKIIGCAFWCHHNYLKSFKGAPEVIGREFQCFENPVYEIYRINPCFEFVEMLNEYDVIHGNKVVELRLRQALEDSKSKFMPEKLSFRFYEVI